MWLVRAVNYQEGVSVAVQGQAPAMTFVWTESCFPLDNSRTGKVLCSTLWMLLKLLF